MSKPQALKDVMKRYLHRQQGREAYLQGAYLQMWNVVVGPTISEQTQTVKFFKKHTMTVYVRDHVWRQELHMRTEELRNRLNELVGSNYLRKIEVRMSNRGMQ